MASSPTERLEDCIRRFGTIIPGLTHIDPARAATRDGRIALYDHAYPLIEQALWSGRGDFSELLDGYQSLFREQDALIQQVTDRRQHDFILGIPVADRPEHLETCLESILQNCLLFGYGGKSGDSFNRIRVVVAEDSRKPESIDRHLELIDSYRRKGLDVIHFGFDEQYEVLMSLPDARREDLGNLLTRQSREHFYLKGQAANRNLCYLKFLQMTEDRDNTLDRTFGPDWVQAFAVVGDPPECAAGIGALRRAGADCVVLCPWGSVPGSEELVVREVLPAVRRHRGN